MQIFEKVFLIVSDLMSLIWASGAFHLSALAIALTIIFWRTASFLDQSKLKLSASIRKFFPQKDWFYFLIIGELALLLYVSYACFYGLPVPRVHDENCYLLMAKTFAANRITNPPHPLSQFFEHFHLINQPTFTAKYPPAQAGFLAVGIVLFGHPIAGVWMSGVLGALACFGMLRAFLSVNWALVGALLFITHPTIFEWSQNYWGGNVALIGGLLCVGSLFRFLKCQRFGDVLVFAVGVAILANSRPFEGLLACLPLSIVIIYWIIKNFRKVGFRRRLFLKFIAPVAFILLLNFAWMGYYNWRVTGNCFKLPYSLYTEQYDPVPLFLAFSAVNQNIDHRHLVMKVFYQGEIENHYQVLRQSAFNATLPVLMLKRVINNAIEFFSATLFLYLAIILASFSVFSRKKKYFFFTSAFFCCLLLEAAATYNQNHYYAPFLPYLIVSITATLALANRQIASVWGRKSFFSFVLALICVQVVSLFVWPLFFEKHLPDPHNSQFTFQQTFSSLPDKHLVLVDYETGDLQINDGRFYLLTILSWIYNEPDLDRSKVVWANNMGDDKNQQLWNYFRDRHVWILGFDRLNNAKLLSCEDLVSPYQPSFDLKSALQNRCPTSK